MSKKTRPSALGHGRARGFTTIELMVASLIALFVALAAGSILFSSQRSHRQGQDKLVMQQEATRAVEQIARDIRRSRWVDWNSGVPSRIALRDHFGALIRVYDRGAVAGVQKARQDGAALTDHECTQLTFTANSDTTTLSIQLELRDRAGNKVKVESKASIRNRPFILVSP